MESRIKKIRQDNTLTQEEFASYLKISKSSVSLLESGRNRPSNQTKAMICEKFGVSMRWLETGDGDPYLPKPAGHCIAEEIRAILRDEDPVMSAVLTSLAQMPPAWWAEWSKALHAEMDRLNRHDAGCISDENP